MRSRRILMYPLESCVVAVLHMSEIIVNYPKFQTFIPDLTWTEYDILLLLYFIYSRKDYAIGGLSV